jgi:hypothetical protein
MIIVSIAAFDEAVRRLPAADALLYLIGLVAVCAVNYVVFSITTLYYIGYLLLIAYIFFALHVYFHVTHFPYHCGQCGTPLRHKGVCPHCGAMNE